MRAAYRFFIASIVASALITAATAQLAIKLPKAGPYKAWYAGEDLRPIDAVESKEDVVSMPKSIEAGQRLVVWDVQKNHLAVRAQKDISDGKIAIREEDFTRIGKVTLKISHSGSPVAAATVVMKGTTNANTNLLSTADKGELVLWGLPFGDYKLLVTYKSAGATKKLEPAPTYTLSQKRDGAEVNLAVEIPDKTDVVTTAAPASTSGASTKPTPAASTAEPKTNTFGVILVYLAALVVGGSVVFFGLQALRKNQSAVEAQLTKLGVAIPKDPDAKDAQSDAPLMPLVPEKVEPIVLSGSTPDPIDLGVGQPIPQAPSNTPAMPRLVAADGAAFFLTATSVVGRDEGADFPFPGETTLSRKHAEFTVAGDTISLRDLGSTNGTFVNGVRNDGTAVVLRLGDEVQLGAVRFRYEA